MVRSKLENKFCFESCRKMLRRVEVTSNFRNVLQHLATWKCIARQVARAEITFATMCSICNATLSQDKLKQFRAHEFNRRSNIYCIFCGITCKCGR